MTPILTVGDFEEARSRERAFVFLFVNWSGPAYDSKRVVQLLADRWQREAADRPVPCYLIDLSDGEGPLWDAVEGWLTEQARPVGPLMVAGTGPLLWVSRGSIVAHVSGAMHKTAGTLLAVARAIFGTDGEPTPVADPPRKGPIWPDDELTRRWLEGIAEARRRADEDPAPWESAE